MVKATGSPPEQSPATAGNLPELAWLVLWLICIVAMVAFPRWQVVPFDLIWIGLALLYGFRLWPDRRALALTVTAAVTTAAAISDDIVRHLHVGKPLEQIPLLATMFVAMAWQAHRRTAARDRAEIAADVQRMLVLQRQFLQDASHQLRTPITIALGHAELLAQALAGQEQRDIHVVVGELERLRALSEGLLLVAASESPDFLAPQPAELSVIVAEVLRRWRPTVPRQWRLGTLDPVTALVDTQRLGLALDALIENAIQHTSPGDQITVSVELVEAGEAETGGLARIVVQDSGEGIAEADLPFIFDRFTTIGGTASRGAACRGAGSRGTGLGLTLVRAIAHGHGGEVRVQSTPGHGSRFELLLPVRQPVPQPEQQPEQAVRAQAGGIAAREAW